MILTLTYRPRSAPQAWRRSSCNGTTWWPSCSACPASSPGPGPHGGQRARVEDGVREDDRNRILGGAHLLLEGDELAAGGNAAAIITHGGWDGVGRGVGMGEVTQCCEPVAACLTETPRTAPNPQPGAEPGPSTKSARQLAAHGKTWWAPGEWPACTRPSKTLPLMA